MIKVYYSRLMFLEDKPYYLRTVFNKKNNKIINMDKIFLEDKKGLRRMYKELREKDKEGEL